MPGTVSRDSISDGHFITLNGIERCYRFGFDSIGGYSCVFYGKPSYDPLFYVVGGTDFISSDFEGCKEIGVDGGFWNNPTAPGQPTWQDLATDQTGTKSYVSPRTGVSYPGIRGISAAMTDWLIVNSNKSCQDATTHWLSIPLGKVQMAADAAFASWAPDPPPVPVPQKDYKPAVVGQVQNTLILMDCQSVRVTLTVDPHDSSRVVLGAGPVPQ